MVISVSTLALSSRRPSSAWRQRRFPSKMNGFVTTPTVRQPSSFATRATTGAAPVPVPPPMPAVTKIMSAPPRCSAMRSTSSRAARFPTSGLPPAPRPRVSFSPSWSLTGERLVRSACASVLAARKSTPGSPAAIMVLTALLPPPPTPITLIRAPSMTSTCSPIAPPPSGVRPRDATRSEELPQPAHHPVPCPPERAQPRPIFLRRHASVSLQSVQHEADSSRIHWTRDDVNQSTEMKRQTEACRRAKHAFRELRHAAEHRAPAGEHDAGREMTRHARALDLAAHQREDFLATRLDHFGEGALR